MIIKYSSSHGGSLDTRATDTCSGIDIQAVGFALVENGELSKETKYIDTDEKCFYVEPKKRILIKTGIKIELPKPEPILFDGKLVGYLVMEVQIRGRSGLSLKTLTDVKIGTVDNEYRSEIGVIFENTGNEKFKVSYLDRVGQLVFQFVYVPIHGVGLIKVDESEIDTNTSRGTGGFGHTGVGDINGTK